MIPYLLFRLVVFIFWLMPFRLLYWLSDGLYYILYYIVRYRRRVVADNLKTAFPEKSDSERKAIEKSFYRHLCDISLEGIKGISTPAEELKARYHIKSAEKVHAYARQGQSILFVGAHIGNWEWGAVGAPMQIKQKVIVLYKAVNNARIDDYVRKKYSAQMSEMRQTKETRQAFIDNQGQTTAIVMIGDQNPSNRRQAHWVNFFGRPTATLHGMAKYAQEYNLPLIFFHTRRAQRGYYEVEEELLIAEPNSLSAQEISEIFMQKVEQSIRQQPANWLWSHKRWKYTQAEIYD